mmetsp:Transcript_15606/g.13650  ORF Transcript_15606/g.13650 Transcript_15606/m.13650 type:complete len:89 (+) Transcript_15606:51-317(+)
MNIKNKKSGFLYPYKTRKVIKKEKSLKTTTKTNRASFIANKEHSSASRHPKRRRKHSMSQSYNNHQVLATRQRNSSITSMRSQRPVFK